MKKPLLTGLCCLLFSGILQARHEQDSVIVQLGEVTIQENRLEIPYNKSSRNVSVITRKAIETTPARSLQEVLSFTPGVDVRQRGVSGVQANIGIRGGSFEQTLMLLNGIKLTDPQTGHHMMNIPVPLMAIQQVDVLKGPGSSIYGQNAFAGAVNIITRLPEEKSIQAQLFGGDFGMRGANAVLSLPVGKYKQTISFSHDASNGHWHNSDFVVNNLFYEGGITTGGKHEWRTMLGYTERDFGANGFYTDAFPDQWEAVSTYLASLSHTYRDGGLYLQTRAYWRRNDDEFRLRREEPEFFTNFHVSDVYALEVNGRYTSSLGSTGFGVEGRSEQLNSTNLGERERYFLGVFGEHRVEFLDRWDARAGVYANFYDEFGWRAFPGAEIGFQASERGRFYSSYGVSFRIPSFTELYYVDPSNSSNPDLLPEEAYNFEVGYKYVGERLRAEAVYFFRDTRNLIDYTRAPVAPGQAPQPGDPITSVKCALTASNWDWPMVSVKPSETSASTKSHLAITTSTQTSTSALSWSHAIR
ncbi:TonB-dependent receptor plug domain-containing protein [Nitritalea halalkaliphila]|uniref:TonB-dependent receptor plug domain-containing protein n=1 Tax=Nitritalea halalkaliphila TaxID=590849 RepID=UPI0002EA44C4